MINRAVAWHTFQQHHWIRISLLGLVLLFVFLSADSSGPSMQIPIIYLTPFLVWLMGSGTIGRDISSGVAHLLFTRPITRTDYILTKWASLTAAVMGFQLFIVLAWLLGKWASHSAFEISSHQMWIDFGFSLWMTATLSTVVILFSTIMSGWGDLALLLYVHVVVLILNMSPLNDYVKNFEKIIYWIMRIIWPGVKLGYDYMNQFNYWNRSAPIEFPNMGNFIFDSIVACVFFFLAVWLMKRKDIGNMNL